MGAYQETVSKIRGGVGTIEGAIPTLQHGAASLANISQFLIPPPIVNWVIAAINTTTAERTAPRRLVASAARHPRSRWRHQCATIPL